MRRVRSLVVQLLLVSVVAGARADSKPVALRGVTADPNAARFGLMFRSAMRAQVGADLALLGAQDVPGFALQLMPLVELHEPQGSDQALPSQYWRARIGLQSSYMWQVDDDLYGVALALEHGSDHETAHEYSTPGFLTQNALMVGGSAQWNLGAVRVLVAPSIRLYLLSCTRDRARCRDFQGDTSVGAQLDVTLDAPRWDLASLVPFVSVHGLGIVENHQVRAESRVALHLGVWFANDALAFQMFALAYLGNEVGITRSQRVAQLGLGFSLAPR